MSTRKIDLKDFAKEIGKWSENSVKELKQATIKGIARSIPDLVAASPVDTGLYAQSWDFTEEEYGALLGNYAPYAGIIEYGARPHVPPIGPLLAWAKRVKGQGGKVDTGQRETDYTPEVWALAKAVQKKISEKGQQPRHIMENMIPLILKNIKTEMEHL